MSAIATFIKLPIASLNELRLAAMSRKTIIGKATDAFTEYLYKNGKEVGKYEWTGYYLGTLLPYLQEHNIDLMKSNFDELSSFLTETRSVTTFIFPFSFKQLYINKLNEINNEIELREYFNNFNEANEIDAGKYMLDGIKTIKSGLDTLDEESVIILFIG
jgi:hypothetical protein